MTSPILSLPPEIYPYVACHIPLQSLPSTLSALSLTTLQIYQHVQPLLYAKLIIKTEDDAFQVLGRLLKDARLGSLVRELRILSDLSVARCYERNGTTVLTDLHEVIKTGHLLHMHTLDLSLLPGWYTDDDIEFDIEGYDHLPDKFWQDLRRKCPRLRGLFLQGIGDTQYDPWMDASGLFELKELSNLSALSLKFRLGSPRNEGALKLLKSVSNLPSSLHTLTICFGLMHQDATPILSLTFPDLKSLELSGFNLEETSCFIDFCARHPGLERLVLDEGSGGWFSDAVKPNLLPNLIHFKASFSDVRALTSHLPQLRSLSISDSKNGQIPYLLRSVLPDGLPNLKSLEIHQIPYSERDVRHIEGATWYETEDGKFLQENRPHKAWMTVTDSYMHSIVRGAPNVEELCIQGFHLTTDDIEQLAPVFAHLPCLERLYYAAFGEAQIMQMMMSKINRLIYDSCLLAESCSSLKLVTDVSPHHFPYLVGKVVRDQRGLVVKAVASRGFGMQLFGGDGDPFPHNPRP